MTCCIALLVADRLAILFDAKLVAYLMMGNLSRDLKDHAVTLFEVGKLPSESLASFIAELNKVRPLSRGDYQGDAVEYFTHGTFVRLFFGLDFGLLIIICACSGCAEEHAVDADDAGQGGHAQIRLAQQPRTAGATTGQFECLVFFSSMLDFV